MIMTIAITIVVLASFVLYKWIKYCNNEETIWFNDDDLEDVNAPKRLQNAKAAIVDFLTDLATINSEYSANWDSNDGHYIATELSALLIEVQRAPIESFDDKEFVKDLWKRARLISSEIFYHE